MVFVYQWNANANRKYTVLNWNDTLENRSTRLFDYIKQGVVKCI